MFTVTFVLVLAALVAAIVNAMGKCPLHVAVILLCIAELIERIPLS